MQISWRACIKFRKSSLRCLKELKILQLQKNKFIWMLFTYSAFLITVVGRKLDSHKIEVTIYLYLRMLKNWDRYQEWPQITSHS